MADSPSESARDNVNFDLTPETTRAFFPPTALRRASKSTLIGLRPPKTVLGRKAMRLVFVCAVVKPPGQFLPAGDARLGKLRWPQIRCTLNCPSLCFSSWRRLCAPPESLKARALLRHNDIHHRACSAVLQKSRSSAYHNLGSRDGSCVAVARSSGGAGKLYAGEEAGVFQLASLGPSCLSEIRRLADKYQSLRPQLADLTLLYLAERDGLETIFTLDRRNFKVFRLANGKELQLLPADL